jgi:hypothetical protein
LRRLSTKWLRGLEILFPFYDLNQIQNIIQCQVNFKRI